jgi:transcriptional regulator with XRE-family HTH domain
MTTVTSQGTPLRARVAEEIRALMGRRRMSGAALARGIGENQQYVSRRLTGEVPFDIDDLEKIAALLDTSVTALLPSSGAAGIGQASPFYSPTSGGIGQSTRWRTLMSGVRAIPRPRRSHESDSRVVIAQGDSVARAA